MMATEVYSHIHIKIKFEDIPNKVGSHTYGSHAQFIEHFYTQRFYIHRIICSVDERFGYLDNHSVS